MDTDEIKALEEAAIRLLKNGYDLYTVVKMLAGITGFKLVSCIRWGIHLWSVADVEEQS